ncbi:MAG: (Na+)-NQR maturation NqrM [Pseudomonadota bacterium]
MATILLTILLMLFVFAAMAIGVLAGRRPIQGSCGGLSALTGPCEVCGGDPAKCDAASAPDRKQSPADSGKVQHHDPRAGS